MDTFTLPDEFPTDADGLTALRDAAVEAFDAIKAKVTKGETVSEAELATLRDSTTAIEKVDAAFAAEETRKAEVADLLAKGTEATKAPEAPAEEAAPEAPEVSQEDADAVVAEAEAVVEETAVAASAKTKFSGLGKDGAADLPDGSQKPADVGWRMDPNTFGYKPGRVGFKEIAEAVDSVKPGSKRRSGRSAPDHAGGAEFSAQTIARLDRNVDEVKDSHGLVAAIEEATKVGNLTRSTFDDEGSLTAAGGWCAPSETLYDFCEVADGADLVSLPEITIRRGGVRWPQEPDMSAFLDNDAFQFFFTEPQLEAVDGQGNPTAIKHCVEVPCPDQFTELRLNAVGWCAEVGILQEQGWPELVEWFMKTLTVHHFRAISKRTVTDIVAGSGAAKIIPAASQIAAGSSVLNSLALMALNLRLEKGISRTAIIEGIAPNWLHEVIRADLANQAGMLTKAVTDAQIDAWFSARNIRLQFVSDWQAYGTGQPGNLATVEYPDTVDVVLYPAGTWFRAMSNVIELGNLYPKEQLQVNRYTKFFTEDAIAVGKRCNKSILVRIPICASGAIGAQQYINCNTPPATP